MKISDFNISGEPIPEDIADKILQYHLRPIEKTSKALGYDLAVSKKSGYRPLWWERERGRNGSQHTFLGKGASDITTAKIRAKQIELYKGLIKYDQYIAFATQEWEERQDEIVESLFKNTEYMRIAVYSTFAHADHAGLERWLFDSNWIRQYQVDR